MSNFNLGLEYESMGQISSALGMYLRTANITNDNELAYVCLLKMGAIFIKLENRPFSTETTFQQAVALLPKRPEAYFLLSQHQERIGKNLESYLTASIALESCDFNLSPLKVDVGYVGKWGIIFEKAVTSWHCGKEDQARALFQTLIDIYWDQMDFSHRASVENNAIRLGCLPVHKTHKHYNKKYHSRLKFQFPGSDQIDRNFAQVYQDLFVLYLLKGKRNGCFLEVGGAKPFEGNNSALLETGFNWCGVSIEYDKNFADNYANERKQTTVLCTDALKINYDELIKNYYASPVIDYLQLDIEPAASTYEALLKIPFNKYKFAVITYEHDYYADVTRSYREKSRKYLTSMGYELVIGNVSPMENCSFEDWWVHPDLVDRRLIDQIKNANSNEVLIEEHFFENHPIIKKKEFDWGLFGKNKWLFNSIEKEFGDDTNYEKFFKVEKNDIVVDIGASVGPFTHSILGSNPTSVFCLEPHSELFKTLSLNLSKYSNIKLINKGISNVDGTVIFNGLFNDSVGSDYIGNDLWKKSEAALGITFDTFLKENNIQKINFLKIDCEGGEYEVFNETNFDWIKNNIDKIAGEWHLGDEILKNKFKKFRDLYLRTFKNHKVFFVDYHSNFFDVTNEIWSDNFVNECGWVNIYIDNRSITL